MLTAEELVREGTKPPTAAAAAAVTRVLAAEEGVHGHALVREKPSSAHIKSDFWLSDEKIYPNSCAHITC